MHRIRIGDENGDSNRSGHALKSPLGMSSGRVFVISENNTERGVGDTNRTCGGTSNESYSIIEEDPLDSGKFFIYIYIYIYRRCERDGSSSVYNRQESHII